MAQRFLSETLPLFENFKHSANQNGSREKSQEILHQLKSKIANLTCSLEQSKPDDEIKALLLSREILENAAMYSLQIEDISSFARYLAQLKTYYYDYSSKLSEYPSSQQWSLLGLNLLRLLASKKIEEFHIELELIPLEKHSNMYIKHPVQLEQDLMEGAYNKVLKPKHQPPTKAYEFFMAELMITVRDGIADCCEKAYEYLSIPEAQKLLGIANAQDLKSYASKRNWKITNRMDKGEIFIFDTNEESKTEIPSLKIIKQTLQYARELERIV